MSKKNSKIYSSLGIFDKDSLGIMSDKLYRIYELSAISQFSINYYEMCECLTDGFYEDIPDAMDIMRQVAGLTGLWLGGEYGKALPELIELRNKQINMAKLISAYSDGMQLCEHMLNRAEFKYKEFDNYTEISSFMTEAMTALLEISNTTKGLPFLSIISILGQLPVRMTRQKFDEVFRSICSYHAGDRLSFDEFMENIMSKAGLAIDGSEAGFEAFYEHIAMVRTLDFSEVSEAEFTDIVARQESLTDDIMLQGDFIKDSLEIINHIIAMCCCAAHRKDSCVTEGAGTLNGEEAENTDCVEELVEGMSRVLHHVNECFLNDAVLDEELAMDFAQLEGKLEKYMEAVNTANAIYDKVTSEPSEEGDIFKSDRGLDMCRRLMSDSVYMELETPADAGKTDEAYVRQRENEFMERFLEFASEEQKQFRQARMASVIEEMPAMFTDIREFKDYMENALHSCHDNAEREASIYLIREILRNERADYNDYIDSKEEA